MVLDDNHNRLVFLRHRSFHVHDRIRNSRLHFTWRRPIRDRSVLQPKSCAEGVQCYGVCHVDPYRRYVVCENSRAVC